MNSNLSFYDDEIESILNVIGSKLSEKQFKLLITEVLRAYHIRESERITNILNESREENHWENLWPHLVSNSSKKHALYSYVHYLMAQMDGGEYSPTNSSSPIPQ